MFIQALVSELAVEGFDEGVLGWFTSLDQSDLHAMLCRPLIKGVTRELRPLVSTDGQWQPSEATDL